MPRLFFAVPLAETAGTAVAALVDDVRAALDRDLRDPRDAPRWVRMDGLHLTLRFLGPVPAEQVDALARQLDELAAGHAQIELAIAAAGAFPSATRPRTLWLGIDDGRESLTTLATDLNRGLETLGWPPETRPFRPHLTLARTDGRRAGPRAAALLIERAADLRLTMRADRVVLYESVTGGGPARYVPIHGAALGALDDEPSGDAVGPPSGVPSEGFATSTPVKSVPDRRSPGSS